MNAKDALSQMSRLSPEQIVFYKKHEQKLVQMQAWFRGILAREHIRALLSELRPRHQEYMLNPDGKVGDRPPAVESGGKQLQLEERPEEHMSNGSLYVGQWLGNHKHGYGVHIWKDGSKYEGHWKYSKACGHGKFTFVDGDTVEGEWSDSRLNGHAIYIHSNGAKYEGQWKDDL